MKIIYFLTSIIKTMELLITTLFDEMIFILGFFNECIVTTKMQGCQKLKTLIKVQGRN